MSVRKTAVGILTTLLAASATFVWAQETPATQPTATRVKLPPDFKQLTDLSDDQKSQILAIRQSTDAQIRELEAKEKTDEVAVLTDAQKSELKEIDAKLASERTSRLAEERRQERIDSTEQKLNELKAGAQPTTNPAAPN